MGLKMDKMLSCQRLMLEDNYMSNFGPFMRIILLFLSYIQLQYKIGELFHSFLL